MSLVELILPAFIIGLLGAGHCLGMCGGITAALSFAVRSHSRASRIMLLVAYNVGRVGSYALMGALLAGAAASLPEQSLPVLQVLSGVLLILLACYLSGLWRVLTVLERAGQRLWRYVQPVGQRLMPVTKPWQALALGMVWGWLPCGLVYSALAFSAVQADALSGGVSMLAFGLGTWPAVLSGGLLADTLRPILQAPAFRYGAALLMLALGLWTFANMGAHGAHHHGHELDAAVEQLESDSHHHHHH